MGSDATISMFDQKLWDEVFIPAVYDLIIGKPVPNWVKFTHASTFDDWNKRVAPHLQKITNFKEHCDIMDDFAVSNPDEHWHQPSGVKPRAFFDRENTIVKCRNDLCASSSSCHYYQKSYSQSREEFSCLFQSMLRRIQCSNFRNVFMGRNGALYHYRELLDEYNILPDARLRELLDHLANRGLFIKQTHTSGKEGIHGWLSNSECREFAIELSKLNLPNTTKINAKNSYDREPLQAFDSSLEGTAVEELWKKHCLGYLCAFADYAGKSGNGIVWINW